MLFSTDKISIKTGSRKNRMKRHLLLYISIALFFIFLSSSMLYEDILDITTTKKNSPIIPAVENKPVRYFGVISRYSPFIIYEGYQPIMDYLSRSTPYKFELKLSKSYEETIHQLAHGRVSAAFLGTYIYIKKRKAFRLACILKPLNHEFRPFFRSVVICSKKRPLMAVSDLAGKKLALPSPLSYSANWLFSDLFPQIGLHKSDLDSIHFFEHHNTVVYQLLRGEFDAGVVKDRVAREYMQQGIQILARSGRIPASPVVVSQQTDNLFVSELTKALLQIDVSKENWRQTVSDWDAEFKYGFISATDADYDSLASIINGGAR